MRCAPAVSLIALTLALAVSGCGSGSGYREPASISSSGYSSSAPSSYSGGSEMSVPQRSGVRADLIVRPDLITVVFALKEAHADP